MTKPFIKKKNSLIMAALNTSNSTTKTEGYLESWIQTYLCWWYKLKSMSDSACKTKDKNNWLQNIFSKKKVLIIIIILLTDFSSTVFVINMSKRVKLTCKRLPSPKWRTSKIVSDWMKAVEKTREENTLSSIEGIYRTVQLMVQCKKI